MEEWKLVEITCMISSHNSPEHVRATTEKRAANNNGRDGIEFHIDTDLAGIVHAEPRRLTSPPARQAGANHIDDVFHTIRTDAAAAPLPPPTR